MKNRTLQFTVALLSGLVLTLALALLVDRVTPVRANPGVRYVAPGGSCNGANPCYGSVQVAVDAAAPGDEIRVAAGTYTDVSVRPRNDVTTTGVVTQVVYISKTITIRGGYTTTNWTTPDPQANPTTLDALGQGRVLYIAGDISPTVEGLHITGGDATGLGGYPWMGYDASGGVYVITATITISNCQVFSNTGYIGGGLYLQSSDATASGNTVTSNTAEGGGGLFLLYSDAMLSRNIISDNTVSQSGGGLDLAFSNATLSGNTITSNTADSGGGLYLWDSDVTLINNVVAGNHADTTGSGLLVLASSPRLLHSTVARNTGGDGSGVYVTEGWDAPSTVALTNTILVSHSVSISVTAGSLATLNATLWHANTTDWSGNVIHTNDYSGSPAFAADGYHLTAKSAAIDAGVDAGVGDDIDGKPRPIGRPDIGADEWGARLYLPLALRNYQ